VIWILTPTSSNVISRKHNKIADYQPFNNDEHNYTARLEGHSNSIEFRANPQLNLKPRPQHRVIAQTKLALASRSTSRLAEPEKVAKKVDKMSTSLVKKSLVCFGIVAAGRRADALKLKVVSVYEAQR